MKKYKDYKEEIFFIDDFQKYFRFHDELIEYLVSEDIDIGENFKLEGIQCKLNSLVEIDLDVITDFLCDRYCDNFPDDSDGEGEYNLVHKGLKESIDIEKFNSIVPKYYYPTGDKFIITRNDIYEDLRL